MVGNDLSSRSELAAVADKSRVASPVRAIIVLLVIELPYLHEFWLPQLNDCRLVFHVLRHSSEGHSTLNSALTDSY